MFKRNLSLFCILFSQLLSAQPAEYKMSPEEYISRYKNAAINEMHRYGIPASITLAQAMLESGNGNSPLAMYANNHFGIKCHSTWDGPTFILDDDAKDECFRKYRAVMESYHDHSEFLKSRKWYEPLFSLKQNDYKGWARGLKKAGYATHPKYAELLINLIESHQLTQFDVMTQAKPKSLSVSTSRSSTPVSVVRSAEIKNNIKFIRATGTDSYQKIADDFQLPLRLLYKYNDLEEDAKLTKGEIIYLQPKRKKAKEFYHIIEKGESLRDVSQIHGIRLKRIYKYNYITPGTLPKEGTKIWLRKHKEAL